MTQAAEAKVNDNDAIKKVICFMRLALSNGRTSVQERDIAILGARSRELSFTIAEPSGERPLQGVTPWQQENDFRGKRRAASVVELSNDPQVGPKTGDRRSGQVEASMRFGRLGLGLVVLAGVVAVPIRDAEA
jgi:hypothetical protein